MTGRQTRRRWVAAVTMGLAAAGATVAQVSMPLPPLVVTPPVAPTKAYGPPPVAAPIAPPVLAEPLVPPPTLPVEVPPVAPTLPPPILPDVVEAPVVKAVPATTVAMVKPVRPPMAEIIATGPKPVDSSKAFNAAMSEAKAALAKVRDYSGHILLQDRVKGQLQAEQTAELRVRVQPKAMSVKFIAPMRWWAGR